ncbi:hypothetical protein DRN62_02290 [Nanoarchaeota archaeon]|nr:MAG: hypothetical protein DRN62_02290 [Nanoarchaeota archaeon]
MDKERRGEGRVMTNNNLRNLVLEVISSKWPCNVTEIAKELGLLSGDERKDRVKINLILYHLRRLGHENKVVMKRIGRNLVVWPTEVEKLRTLKELMEGI